MMHCIFLEGYQTGIFPGERLGCDWEVMSGCECAYPAFLANNQDGESRCTALCRQGLLPWPFPPTSNLSLNTSSLEPNTNFCLSQSLLPRVVLMATNLSSIWRTCGLPERLAVFYQKV